MMGVSKGEEAAAKIVLDIRAFADVGIDGNSGTGAQPSGVFCATGAVAIEGRRPRWYCVLTKPQQEKRAADELRRQDFLVFCPLVERPPKIRDRLATMNAVARAAGHRMRGRPPKPRQPQMVAAIRGYVFVQIDLRMDRWTSIRSTQGVVSSEERSVFLCMVQGEPYAIPNRQIEILQREVMAAGTKADLVKALMEAGEVVRVADGPFASFPGTVIQQRGDHVWLHVEVFGRSTPVELLVAQVERV